MGTVTNASFVAFVTVVVPPVTVDVVDWVCLSVVTVLFEEVKIEVAVVVVDLTVVLVVTTETVDVLCVVADEICVI